MTVTVVPGSARADTGSQAPRPPPLQLHHDNDKCISSSTVELVLKYAPINPFHHIVE